MHTYEELRSHENDQDRKDKSLLIVTCKAHGMYLICCYSNRFLLDCASDCSLLLVGVYAEAKVGFRCR